MIVVFSVCYGARDWYWKIKSPSRQQNINYTAAMPPLLHGQGGRFFSQPRGGERLLDKVTVHSRHIYIYIYIYNTTILFARGGLCSACRAEEISAQKSNRGGGGGQGYRSRGRTPKQCPTRALTQGCRRVRCTLYGTFPWFFSIVFFKKGNWKKPREGSMSVHLTEDSDRGTQTNPGDNWAAFKWHA